MKYSAGIIGLGRIGSILEDDPLRIKPHTHAGFMIYTLKLTSPAGATFCPSDVPDLTNVILKLARMTTSNACCEKSSLI